MFSFPAEEVSPALSCGTRAQRVRGAQCVITELFRQGAEEDAVASSEGFEVTPADLHNTADAYLQESGVVSQALATFEAATNLPASAFGNLPNSSKFASQFESFGKQVQADMKTLVQSLAAGSQKLTANALKYQVTDQRNAQAIRGTGSTE